MELNNINYSSPSKPLAVVCIDGGDPEYFQTGLQDGIIPNIARFMKEGFYQVARGSMPSFTCPNNMSIVTGSEPENHGISGNFFIDPETQEVIIEVVDGNTGEEVRQIPGEQQLRLNKGISAYNDILSKSADNVEYNGVDDMNYTQPKSEK